MNFKKLNFQFGYGNDFNIYKQGFNNAISITFGKKLFGKIFVKNSLNMNLKNIFWRIKNPSNLFVNYSLCPEFSYEFKVKNNYSICLNAGIVGTSNLIYKRFQYKEIGFPKELQPEFGIKLFYKI